MARHTFKYIVSRFHFTMDGSSHKTNLKAGRTSRNEDVKKKRDPDPEWRTQDWILLGGNLRFQLVELETKL